MVKIEAQVARKERVFNTGVAIATLDVKPRF